MKWILNLFPRTWLIGLSIRFQPFLKFYFRGNLFTDPIDGSNYRKFLPYGYQNIRENALCPGTLSLERHRLLWLFLERETRFLNKEIKVLHVAPEQVFFKKFKLFSHWEYTTTDLHSPLADIKADICNLPFKNNYYDLILCNHVLEHISDDLKAMKELYRVLKKGGTLIAQVPINLSQEVTFEDNTITDPKERTKIFGQYDHLRNYGLDYFSRLSSVGFEVKANNFLETLSIEEKKRFCLPKEEKIPVALK